MTVVGGGKDFLLPLSQKAIPAATKASNKPKRRASIKILSVMARIRN
jgi:hypothetical protein